jgi:outer membrane protein
VSCLIPHLTCLLLLIVPMAYAQESGLTLEAALARLANAPNWRAADLQFASVQGRLEAALAAAGLAVNGTSDYSASRITDSGEVGQNLNLSVQVNINVLPWSNLQAQIQSAQINLERARLDRDEARNLLALNVVSQFVALRLAGLDLELARGTQTLRDHQLQAARTKAAVGSITPDALRLQEQLLERARVALAQALGTLEIARLTLSGTLGLPAANLAATNLTDSSVAGSSPVSGSSPPIERRTDIRKATIAVLEAQTTLDLAMLERVLPDAGLKLSYGQKDGLLGTAGLNFKTGQASLGLSLTPVNTIPANSATAGGTTFTFAASINLPIVSPGGNANVANAQRNLELTQQALEAAKRNAQLDIAQKQLDIEMARQRLELARTTVRLNLATLETTRARLTAGLVIALELEAAQIDLFQANRDLEAALLNARVAELQFLNAIGSLTLIPASASVPALIPASASAPTQGRT